MARLVKKLRRISITTTREAEDAVSEMLGAIMKRPAVSYFDLDTGKSTVTVYCEDKLAAGVPKAIAEGLERIKECGLKVGAGKIRTSKMPREDWAESWKRHFKPMEINPQTSPGTRAENRGKSLLIKPGWSKKRARRNQAVVILNPGLSFGTGQHPTTAFCLREIVRLQNRVERPSFLDIGSGSGILAIAAAKLGYAPVRAMDCDAGAVRIARANARANRVGTRLKINRGDVARLPLHPARRYDLVCANLISGLLIAERRRIAAQLNRGGTLVLAGVLKSEYGEVRKAFKSLRLKPSLSKTERGWQSGSFERA